jgi:transposase
MHKTDQHTTSSRKGYPMDIAYLGIDIAKVKFDVALLRPDQKVRAKAFANTATGHTELLTWLARQHVGPVHACLEATGTYGDALTERLADAGLTVSVVNPAAIEAYGRSRLTRTKTDRTDARVIAHFCATQRPAPWTPVPRELRDLQAFVRRLDALEGMRQQERNRLAAEPAHTAVRTSIQHVIELLDEEMAALRTQIQDHFTRHPGLRAQRDLLISIPGIGEATAAVVLAELGVITRFERASACAAFVGLVPRQGLSGTSVRRKPVLSKLGTSGLRKALYFPALTAMRHNPILRAHRERLLARGKHRMVIVGAIMRKLVHLVYGVLKNGKPFDADYATGA